MAIRLNEFEQPIGDDLSHWLPPKAPKKLVLEGMHCRLERLNVGNHANDLFQAFQESSDDRDWTYLPYGPFHTLNEYVKFLESMAELNDPYHYTVIDKATQKAVGTTSLMRIDTTNGVIEVGHVVYSKKMQRSKLSTEVMALLLQYVFEELGYRRLEWKCDSLNKPSRIAAERFGFTFEGIFRQSQVTQGRNRDTAWYSILDSEYAAFRSAYVAWLAPNNFDSEGNQLTKLGELISKQKLTFD